MSSVSESMTTRERADQLLEECSKHAGRGEVEPLTESIRELETLHEDLNDPHVVALTEMYSAMLDRFEGHLQEAEERLIPLIKSFEELGDFIRLSRIKTMLGSLARGRGDIQAMGTYLSDAVQISKGARDGEGITFALRTRVHGFVTNNGQATDDKESILAFFEDSIDALETIGDAMGMCESLSDMTFFTSNMLSDQQMALRFGHRAIEVVEQAGDLPNSWLAYDALGGVYWAVGDTGKGAEYHLKAVSLAEQTGNPYDHCRALANAAYVFIQLEDFAKVAEMNRKALALVTPLEPNVNRSYSIGWNELGLAHALLNLGELEEAFEQSKPSC